ncbi:zinc-binding dehydrogenase [Castellaniella sp.]|uniref:zinc-binding dehydrogenase n=1 Tax=Castellaniella sp. TaxID=1955812 RepID=UPI002AFDE369|nr:zinc-binding dehydrogenase [Castellaniella sp.]
MRAHAARLVDDRIRIESRDVPVPEPGPRQLLVRVCAAGLNRGELLALRKQPAGTQAILGIEAAGEVVRAGADAGPFKAGDRVMGRCRAAFADYALLDAHDALVVPERLSWAQAAALPIAAMVVYDMLIAQGRLVEDEWLLVTGISSGVGVTALQLAKALGARVIGTSGSAGKLAALERLGLDVGLRTRAPDFHDAVMAATGGRGANLIVNIAGGSVFAECVRTLAFEGRLATVGYMDGVLEGRLDLAALHARRLTIFGVSSKGCGPERRRRIVQGVAERVLPLVADGRFAPAIDRVFPFDELEAAIARMESDEQLGKIVAGGT